MTVYSNDMKTYGMRRGVAAFLGMPQDRVRVVWMQGPAGLRTHGGWRTPPARPRGSRTRLGRPVRMQWMRDEETAWDTKSPAFLVKMRGALDATGTSGRVRLRRAVVRLTTTSATTRPDTVLIAQLMGSRRATPAAGSAATPSGHVCDPEQDDERRGGRAAGALGDAASHGQPARSERSAVDIRRGIVHRRSRSRRRRPMRSNSA